MLAYQSMSNPQAQKGKFHHDKNPSTLAFPGIQFCQMRVFIWFSTSHILQRDHTCVPIVHAIQCNML